MKSAEFLKSYGEFTKNYGHLLDHPIFTVSRLQKIEKGITYRMLNAWESEGLILSSREKLDTGWRKFSIIDCVKLKVIFDLRKLGCSRKRVKDVMRKWNSGEIDLWSPKENRMLRLTPLEVKNIVITCLSNVTIFLKITEKESLFLSETGAKSFYLRSSNRFSPTITLPFFSYVKKTAGEVRKKMGIEKNSTKKELFDSMLPYQEERISRWIRGRNYKEIVFTDSQLKETRIKSQSKRGKRSFCKNILKAISSGDYCSIVITTRRGQKITIVRKEWMKK